MGRIGGLLEEILSIAESGSADEKATIYVNLAVALAHKGDIAKMEEVAEANPAIYNKVFSYIRIAEILPAYLKKAEILLKENDFTLPEKLRLYARLSCVSKDLDHIEYALGLADLHDSSRTDYGNQRFIIIMLATVGRTDEARSHALSLPDELNRALAFTEIAMITGDLADIERIQKSRIEASQLILSIYLKLGKYDKARRLAETLINSSHKATSFLMISANTRNEHDLRQAMLAAEDVADFRVQPLNLCDIGISLAKVGDSAGARSIADTIGNLLSYEKKCWLQTKVLIAIFEES